MKAGQIEKGMCILSKNNEPYMVQDREFVNPGKGAAFVRCKFRNLLSGQILNETIKSHDTINLADVQNGKGQYLYEDDEYYHFMETESFEQYTVSVNDFENYKNYLREGEVYQLMFFNDVVINVMLPPKVVLVVTQASQALKGDTATSVTKIVECDTGIKVKVPGFIKENDKILVNTETGEYTERCNA